MLFRSLEQEAQSAANRAIDAAGKEIAQLRQTIVTLRDAIESSQAEHEEEMQRHSILANDQAMQLQSTITALRAQLEELAAQVISQKQAAIAAAAAIRLLRIASTSAPAGTWLAILAIVPVLSAAPIAPWVHPALVR